MAGKSKRILVIMRSSEDNGYQKTTVVNPQNMEGKKLELKMYDPVARKHVMFHQKKIK